MSKSPKKKTPQLSVAGQHRVLIADDEEGLRFVLRQLLEHEGCKVDEAANGRDALKLARAKPYDLTILDIKMPLMSGMDVLREIRSADAAALVVMMTAYGSQSLAIEALQAGAYDYFTKPFEMEALRITLRRALDKQALLRKVQSLEKSLGERRATHRMIGSSHSMQQVYELVRRVSNHDITVLILGESGTGKELVAEAIHNGSAGVDKPFIRVNCAAIPEPLLESELFGHDKGAFTGAVAAKAGKFELADGGSILLDEIGEMPLSVQSKLLRVLQEKQVERVGETRVREIDVRIIVATNRDLKAMVSEKTFREDLYFRINVMSIHIPPLRERIEDIALLADHFLAKHIRNGPKRIEGFTPEAIRMMETYSWPGNVRELENTVQRAIIMASGALIDADALPSPIVDVPAELASPPGGGGIEALADSFSREVFGSLTGQIDRLVSREEKRIILAALREANERRQETADLLGISRKSLHNKMQKYGLLKRRSER